MEEFIENFMSDSDLTPIDIVSDITGLSIDELRSTARYVCINTSIPDPEAINDAKFEERLERNGYLIY